MALTMASCGGGRQQAVEFEEDTTRNVVIRDSTYYGICGEGSAMNTLQLLTDNGDTMIVSVTTAKDNDQVFGSYSVGDRMAVLMEYKSKSKAKIVVNLSELLGNWVMPNPIDGSSEMGIRLKEGGIAESIEQSSIIYKSWKMYNGKLQIVSQRDGGGDEEETNLYEIMQLGPDTLVYRDAEDTFEYSRQKAHNENSKIKLEQVEDFKM